MKRWMIGCLAGGFLWLLAGCGDEGPTSPIPAAVAGQYVVNSTRGEFIFSENGQTWDLASEGATIDLYLFQNGTTAGRIFVPSITDAGQDYDASLDGMWVVRNDSVFVSQSVATVISSMGLAIDGDTLRGEQQFEGAHVKVTLVR